MDACSFVKDSTSLTSTNSFFGKWLADVLDSRDRTVHQQLHLCFEMGGQSRPLHCRGWVLYTHPQEFDGSHFSYDLVPREQDRETPDYIPNVLHLYKIHGSLDWRLDGTRIIKDPATKKPHIIYPRYSKYESSYDQPFIEMMSRLQISLRQPHTGLVIVGFGFNDYHICQPLLSAIKANVNLKAIVVDPAIETSTKAIPEEIRSLITLGDSRLALLAGGFEEFVSIIPDLVAATEEEKAPRATSENRGCAMTSPLPLYPFDPERLIGTVSEVGPTYAKANLPRAAILEGQWLHGHHLGAGEVRQFVVIQCGDTGAFGRVISVKLPDADQA